MMSSLKTTSICRSAVVGSIALLSLPALAGTPQAMTMVPNNADAVVVIPDLGELISDMNVVNTMLGDAGSMEVTMMTSVVRGMPGLNLDGSAAVVLDISEHAFDNMDAVVLVPVSSFADLSQGREAVDGLVELPMGGDSVFLRDLGDGYAAMSNDTSVLSAFVPASHTMDQAKAMLGTAGNRAASSNDLMMYLNLEAIRPMLDASVEEMEAQIPMIEMMAGADAAQGFNSFMDMYKTAIKDGHAAVSGLSFDPQKGFAFDFGMQFKEGSKSASKFNNDGNAGAYFDRVPAMDFFYAQAFDLRGEGIQSMLTGYMDMVKDMNATEMMKGMDFAGMMKSFQGGSMVMGTTNIMGMTGLMSNTVMYSEGGDAENTLEMVRDMYNSMGEVEQQGVSIKSSFDDEPQDINGIQAYAHSMTINVDQAAMGGAAGFGAPDPAMIMQMVYGPSRGPAGYAAEAGDGMVFTFSQNPELLKSAVDAADGKNTMMSNKGIAAAASMLPDNRVMEAYVGIDHILNSVGPMLMMFGVVPEFEPVDGLTPLAFGATADGGGMMIRTVMPLETIQTIMEMIPQDMMGGGNDWDDDDDMSF
ncbi:MAG: hypothetical protein JJ974_08875 [Phycisphaerales bacterium]|nr:hypothetical protein [Phycisphaerales bacterium]